MDKIILPIVRTVFLPQGSPGICTIKQITTDIRDSKISAENGQIFVSGEVDIIIDYLSYATDETSNRSSGFRDLDEYLPGSGRLWQALLTLPFEVSTTGILTCSSNCLLVTGEIKWFLVSPHAIEMSMDLLLKEAVSMSTIDNKHINISDKDELEQGMSDYQQGLRDLQQGLQELHAGEAERQAGEAQRQAGLAEQQMAMAEKTKTVFEKKIEMPKTVKQENKSENQMENIKMPENVKLEIKPEKQMENIVMPKMKMKSQSENMPNTQMPEMKMKSETPNMPNAQMPEMKMKSETQNMPNAQMPEMKMKQPTKMQYGMSEKQQSNIIQQQTTPNTEAKEILPNLKLQNKQASGCCYKMRFYRVRPDDTWSDIALKTGCNIEVLIDANGIGDRQLTPGKVLIIK